MICLSENEVGFSATDLGFPSIRGCHAVVYVTANGMFGLHNFGGDNADQWQERSTIFTTFVRGHANGTAAGKLLYGVCFATGNGRGYGTVAPIANWTKELTAFASALGYAGPIWGYDLAKRGILPPAYVLFHSVGDTCVIQAKAWNDGEKTEGANNSPADYQMIARNSNGVGYQLKATKAKVVTSVTTAGLVTVYPEKLRG